MNLEDIHMATSTEDYIFFIDQIVVKIVESLLLEICLKSPTTMPTTLLTNNNVFLLFAYDNILKIQFVLIGHTSNKVDYKSRYHSHRD